MSPLAAVRSGIRRVNRAPALVAGVWAISVAISLPLALSVRRALADALGWSLEAGAMASGASYDWMQEFSAQASGPAATLGPAVIGFGAVLDNLSAFADAERQPFVVAAAVLVYLTAWTFLSGGIIDRLARDRATRAHGFFSASGVFFFRFARLAVVSAIVYGALFGLVHPWLFDGLFGELTRDVTVERTAFLIRAAFYSVFGMALAGSNMLFDYAKVRAVVEDRRSAAGALAAALRFVRRNGASAAAVYAMNAGLFALVLVVYALIAPGAGSTGVSMWLGFAVGQVYVLTRLWVKLVFWASETALFQGRLAHAGYVASAPHVWPDSPAAEAIHTASPAPVAKVK